MSCSIFNVQSMALKIACSNPRFTLDFVRNLKTVKERSRSRLQSVHRFQRKGNYNEFSQ